ncbi:MAG: aminoglycoside phosphotransferase family protein [Oligosphaeraceae bacterium]|nr:aminoglycoside phosphotransferase family protein [Oligosphaeraceae bacterium]
MNPGIKHDLSKVVPFFRFRGIMKGAEPWGSGHINDTYRLHIEQGGRDMYYILQRINDKVFPHVDKMMDNIRRVTTHIREKLEKIPDSNYSRESLCIVYTLDDKPFYLDVYGNFWRAYVFVEHARTYDFVSSPEQAYQAAKAFGRFQSMLRDLPGGPLHEVIPDFHNTPRRFEKFQAALAADKLGRAAAAQAEISFALARQGSISVVVDKLASGELPTRVTHNDTKINNVMLNDADGQGICVIDLDTVMPGSVLYDFGDEVRTTTASAAEDERDLSKVKFRLELFSELVRGYMESAGDFLTPEEVRLLPFSGQLITFEIGLRFLTDYLEGDTYFKTHREGQNLDRCRTQFEMVRQMEEQAEAMEGIVAQYRR